jgi:magnesium-transporting ATPase (P-type)
MLGFTAVLWAAGWRAGEALPGAAVLLAASGTAFAAVVLGQAANAFACRSTTDGPGTLGWTTNRLLLIGVAVELLLLLLFLYTPPLAAFLSQAPPTALGWLVAALAVPAVLLADLAHKRLTIGGQGRL